MGSKISYVSPLYIVVIIKSHTDDTSLISVNHWFNLVTDPSRHGDELCHRVCGHNIYVKLRWG